MLRKFNLGKDTWERKRLDHRTSLAGTLLLQMAKDNSVESTQSIQYTTTQQCTQRWNAEK